MLIASTLRPLMAIAVLLSALWSGEVTGQPSSPYDPGGRPWAAFPDSGTIPITGAFSPMAEAVDTEDAGHEIPAGSIHGPSGLAELCGYPPASEQGTWVGFAGGYRMGQGHSYDPRRNRILAFGGHELGWDGFTNQVWELPLDGPDRWRELCPTGALPGLRFGSIAVYDSTGDQLLVFGGAGPGSLGNIIPLSDIWTLRFSAGPQWSPLVASGEGPPASMFKIALFDEARRRVYFVGLTSGSLRVWCLSLEPTPTWSSPATENSSIMSGRYSGYFGGLAYDSRRDQIVVFGGWERVCHHGCFTRFENTVRLLPLGGPLRWTIAETAGDRPVPRGGTGFVYDRANDRIVMAGGFGSEGSLTDTWSLSLGDRMAWAPLPSALIGPAPDPSYPMFHDGVRGRMLVTNLDSRNDVWELWLADSGRWREAVGGPHRPGGLSSSTLVCDVASRRLLVFGGHRGSTASASDQLWTMDLIEKRWMLHGPSGHAPEARYSHSAIFEPVRGRMVIFGGSGGSYLADVWTLRMGDAPGWEELHPSGTPPSARLGHSAIYDPIGDRMIVFGGLDANGRYLEDIWALSLGSDPRWEQLTAPTGPSPRAFHLAAYDPASHRMLMFSGRISPYASIYDTWALELEGEPRWRPVAQAGMQPPRVSYKALVYDDSRLNMVALPEYLYDGQWELTLDPEPRWSLQSPAGRPPGQISGAAHDPVADQTFVLSPQNGEISLLHRGNPPISVEVDLRSGDGMGPVIQGERVVSAVVSSAMGFDATRADLSSVTLAHAPVRRNGNGTPNTLVRDVNRDGLPDLVCKFEAARMRIGPLDANLVIRGSLAGGRRFRGAAPFSASRPGGSRSDAAASRETDAPGASQLSVRPNRVPSPEAVVLVLLNGDETATLDVFDVRGRKVLGKDLRALGAGQHAVSLRDEGPLPQGLYFVRVAQGDRRAATRLIVME